MARSIMKHQFSEVPKATIPRSSFDRSSMIKTTFDASLVIPIFMDEALPGDTFNLKMTAFSRMSTPIYPVMDNIYMDTFFFAVPFRLVWDNWQKLNGERVNPDDSIDYTTPTMTSPTGGYQNETLNDYFGIPTLVEGLEHNCLFHRAHNLIRNDWFRDQNLQDSFVVPMDDGPDDPTNYILYPRGKRHDYFTSCLPWPQKGEAVSIPIEGEIPVLGIAKDDINYITASGTGLDSSNTLVTYTPTAQITQDQIAGRFWVEKQGDNTAPNIRVDLADGIAVTVNELRTSTQIQKMLERDARGGTRYTEIIKAHFGVTSPDARLQRPEYLGGGSTPINITPIASTVPTDISGTPQGNLAAMATATIRNNGFVKSFTEHCLILGYVSVRADLTYQTGLHRMWSRQTRYDYYWPALSHIGEQAVLNKEIYAQGSAGLPAGIDELTFGFQERFAEFRYKPSMITGKFRSNDPQSLDPWHLSQDFGNLPVLDSTFIEENVPMARVLATGDSEPHFIFDGYIQLRTARPMPLYSVPGLIDHF